MLENSGRHRYGRTKSKFFGGEQKNGSPPPFASRPTHHESDFQ
jgi:hypothetical protein